MIEQQEQYIVLFTDKDRPMKERNRIHYFMWTAITIVAGCAVRSDMTDSWSPVLVKAAGDMLWALMLFLIAGTIFTRIKTAVLTAGVLALAFGVEFSQLFSACWIDTFRRTFIGAVTIGSGFYWTDLAYYTAGCAIGAIAEKAGQRT